MSPRCCVCSDLGLVLLASLGLSVGFAGQSTGQRTNDVGTGDLPEGEICPPDEHEDLVNSQTVLAQADLDGNGVVQITSDVEAEFNAVTIPPASFEVCSGNDPNQLPCGQANPGVMGCEDPNCCKLVFQQFSIFCCTDELGWIQACADAAISIGCATPCCDGPACMATGPDSTADGYLAICPDPYGSWSSDTFCGPSCNGAGDPNWGDDYNPIGGLTNAEASFTNGLFFFQRDDMGNGITRELLSNIIAWQGVFDPDESVDRALIAPHELGSDAFDTNGDGVYDRFESSFELTGRGLDLVFELTQEIEKCIAGSVFTQTYDITNMGGDSIDFSLLRFMDLDLVWSGDFFDDDSVGTGTNGSAGCDRHVFQTEPGLSSTAIKLSSPQGDIYFGAKGEIPDLWNEYGVPRAWENFIAGVGANIDGESGPKPPGDASVGLEIPVIGLAPGAFITVVVQITYGSPSPCPFPCHEPCLWDCGGDNDNNVGIVDMLVLLAQWGQVGVSCDFDGGGVGIVDFLKLLARWGPCF